MVIILLAFTVLEQAKGLMLPVAVRFYWQSITSYLGTLTFEVDKSEDQLGKKEFISLLLEQNYSRRESAER